MVTDRDHELRMACFLALDALRAQFGPVLACRGALDRGFEHGGARVPFLNHLKGIFRARAQRGPAALSLLTSARSPYDDEQTDEGFWSAFRDGAQELADNCALRWRSACRWCTSWASCPGCTSPSTRAGSSTGSCAGYS